MSNIVNLNRFKKKKTRAEKEARAEANRASFGRTKAERQLKDARDVKEKTILDGHKLDKDDETDKPD